MAIAAVVVVSVVVSAVVVVGVGLGGGEGLFLAEDPLYLMGWTASRARLLNILREVD